MQDALAGRLRPSGLPALRPRPHARGAAIRPERRTSCAASRSRSARASAPDDLGLASISASTTGALAYRPGMAARGRLVWIDRKGKETPALDQEGEYADASFSPDGRRLVFDIGEDNDKGDLWIRDFARGTTTRFTFEPSRRVRAGLVAGREADRLLGAAEEGGPLLEGRRRDRRARAAAGERRGQVRHRLVAATGTLVFASRGGDRTGTSGRCRMTGDRKPFPLRKTQFVEVNGSLSPDGRFLAFQSNESGRHEIYVQEFPEARSKWQVSTERRSRAVLAEGRPRALLPLPRRPLDGRAGREGRVLHYGNAAAALPGALRADPREQPLSRQRPTASGSW